MKARNNVRKRIDALTPVISAIMAIAIAVSIEATVIAWGALYIEEMQDKEMCENVEMQFNSIVDGIEDLVSGTSGETKTTSVTIDEGSVYINKNEYDRTIVMYSLDSNYDFTVSGLNDDDYVFYLIMDNIVAGMIADVQWLDEYNNEEQKEKISISLDGEITSSYIFKGIVNISLYEDQAHKDAGDEFGKIWLFDSNFLTYTLSSSRGTQEVTIEKGGIIYSDSENPQLKRAPKIRMKEETIAIRVIQIIAPTSFSAGGSGFKFTLNTNSYGNYVREKEYIYYSRLQFYKNNDPATVWLNYFSKNYKGYIIQESSDTLFYEPSDPSVSANGVWLTLSHSTIEFNIS